MVEEQRARIDEALLNMINDIDKSYLRIIQGKMFRCAAACCDDKTGSVNTVQKCIETCEYPLQSAQKFVQQEINHLQDRFQRCIMTCNDSIRDKMGSTPTESEVYKYTKEFEGCAKKCVDTHIDLVPGILKKMKEVLGKKEFSSN